VSVNRKEFLGEFEELVLLIVAALQPEAYGKQIVEYIDENLQRHVSLSAVHITLYRLEDKGLLYSRVGGIIKERGGRRKRFFKVTNTGLSLLRSLKNMRSKLWSQIPLLR
jgi:PadR family transcriptional regulator, regulatory protein PadR